MSHSPESDSFDTFLSSLPIETLEAAHRVIRTNLARAGILSARFIETDDESPILRGYEIAPLPDIEEHTTVTRMTIMDFTGEEDLTVREPTTEELRALAAVFLSQMNVEFHVSE